MILSFHSFQYVIKVLFVARRRRIPQFRQHIFCRLLNKTMGHAIPEKYLDIPDNIRSPMLIFSRTPREICLPRPHIKFSNIIHRDLCE